MISIRKAVLLAVLLALGAVGSIAAAGLILVRSVRLDVDALVLESVYSDIRRALTNRLRVRLGRIAGSVATPVVAPLLEALMPPVLGVRWMNCGRSTGSAP